MGRRATRRRHKKRYNQRKNYYSDPDDLHVSQTIGEGGTKGERWESLDDLALLDYADNAATTDPATLRNEMEVTRRLSCLNVSMAACTDLWPSDVETVCSECPLPWAATLPSNLPGELVPLDRLKERHCRKRTSKRSRKRTKKPKPTHLPPLFDEKRPTQWVRPTTSSNNPRVGVAGGCDSHNCSDVSSRALTDSDSLVLDDIIMLESDIEESGMDGLEVKSLTRPSVAPPTSQLLGNSESDSNSDSGCDGDDEESSAEITGCLKVGGVASLSRRGLKLAYNRLGDDDKGFSSAEDLLDDRNEKQTETKLQWLPKPDMDTDNVFEHPQQWDVMGVADSAPPIKQAKGKKRLIPTIASPQDLSDRIKNFVQFSAELDITLPMMSRALCRTANSLADLHNLDCVISNQKRRLPVASPVLRKTCCTRLARESEIEGVLKNHRQEVINSVLSPRKQKRVKLPIHVPVSVLTSSVQKKLVGGNAPPISETNLGNRLLQGMGWKPGNGLGRNENGIQDPLFAEIRSKTAGLGYAL